MIDDIKKPSLLDEVKKILAQDLEIVGKATKGPWCRGKYAEMDGESVSVQEVNDSTGWKKDYPHAYLMVAGGWGYTTHGSGNADFIAHSRNVFESRVKALEIALETLSFLKTRWDEIFAEGRSYDEVDKALKEIARELGIKDD